MIFHTKQYERCQIAIINDRVVKGRIGTSNLIHRSQNQCIGPDLKILKVYANSAGG